MKAGVGGFVLAALLTGSTLAQSADATYTTLVQGAMHEMHRAMNAVPKDQTPDEAFLAMMIPHHQGAIDAAKAVLLYGEDPQVRRLAQEILTEQQLEVELMTRLSHRTQGPR